MLELHCHTTYSDGTLTPAALVDAAVNSGVQALAITDHDTMGGWDEAIAAAPTSLEIVPGLELSTVCAGRSLHVLGFYPDRRRLQAPLDERLEGRKRRAQAMIEKLAELGYPIELSPMVDGMAPGRPHIAAAMHAAGYVTSTKEAFSRFLAEGKPACVAYEKFDVLDGIKLLRSCGAVPVWAHPYLFRGAAVEAVLPEFVEAGLMGLEVYHPDHSPSDVRHLEDFCQQYGLLKTGGSDFHGPSKRYPGLNSLHLPLALLDGLKQAKQSLAA
ncbi:PHP domain-containing protein [filamentous cyanobacterium LEGE 11480]|uniref:PHP domain-containing protein n=1 Tax=Romeriopsis navalis LEGE 11480 TaxID=2777977 RepID=A0A928VTJ3_9CYAN|nr:PHP domain-containing protein [Romeriopsis navalis]MBE9033473.1 PHP domain-containing protein [Romeriopsis navalis LEGE 11480]